MARIALINSKNLNCPPDCRFGRPALRRLGTARLLRSVTKRRRGCSLHAERRVGCEVLKSCLNERVTAAQAVRTALQSFQLCMARHWRCTAGKNAPDLQLSCVHSPPCPVLSCHSSVIVISNLAFDDQTGQVRSLQQMNDCVRFFAVCAQFPLKWIGRRCLG